jgi:nucleoside-diphosphate-sugar epimerase
MPTTRSASAQRVAVTGAAGFIGSAVCRRLVADGDEPIGIDLAGADRIADVSDAAATVAALGGADAVIHTAAIVSERGRMADFVRVNTRGTRNMLDAAAGRPAVVLASVAAWGYEFTRELDSAREFFSYHARSLGQDRVRVLPAPLLRLTARAVGAGPAAVTFMSRRAVYPNTRAREELRWRPRVSLEEGMARTLGDRT